MSPVNSACQVQLGPSVPQYGAGMETVAGTARVPLATVVGSRRNCTSRRTSVGGGAWRLVGAGCACRREGASRLADVHRESARSRNHRAGRQSAPVRPPTDDCLGRRRWRQGRTGHLATCPNGSRSRSIQDAGGLLDRAMLGGPGLHRPWPPSDQRSCQQLRGGERDLRPAAHVLQGVRGLVDHQLESVGGHLGACDFKEPASNARTAETPSPINPETYCGLA